MQYFSHKSFESICQAAKVELIPCDEKGIAVLSVGSGLLMATIDAVHDAGLGVHCAVDMGRVAPPEMARLIEWAAYSAEHRVVFVHTWHSRSFASDLAGILIRQYPAVITGQTPVPVVFRLRGLGEERIPRAFPNHPDWDDTLRAVRKAGVPGEVGT